MDSISSSSSRVRSRKSFSCGDNRSSIDGVGYAWSEWLIGEHTLCSKGGVRKEIQTEDLGDLKERIARQGAFIRDLKENQGLGNKDPEVVEAVAELIRLKNLDGHV